MSLSCEKCQKTFSNRFNKDRHMLNICKDPKDDRLVCDICENEYKTKSGLRRHMKSKHKKSMKKKLQVVDDNTKIPLSKDTIYKTLVMELRSNENIERQKIMAKIRQGYVHYELCEVDELLSHMAEYTFNNPDIPELMNFCIRKHGGIDTYLVYYGNNTWVELEELEITNILKSTAICFLNELRRDAHESRSCQKTRKILENEKVGLPSEFQNTREVIRNFHLSKLDRQFIIVEKDPTLDHEYIKNKRIKEMEAYKKALAKQDRARQDYDIQNFVIPETIPVEDDPLKIDDVSTNGKGETFVNMEEEDEYIPSEEDANRHTSLFEQMVEKKRLEFAAENAEKLKLAKKTEKKSTQTPTKNDDNSSESEESD